MSAPVPAVDRPTPIRDAVRSVGGVIVLVGTLVNVLVSMGVIDAAQGTAVQDLAAAVPGLIELVVALLAAFHIVKRAEPLVTPIADPAVVVDGELVALTPDVEPYGDHAARDNS
jgi:hypothetical protein